MDIRQMNTTALAYIGDAVYEVYVRQHVMDGNAANVDVLHKKAVAFVRADGQAFAIKKFVREKDNIEAPSEGAFRLTDDEAAIVRRARNHKSASRPRNTDPVTYKWATAFEALVGYLYLRGETERLDVMIKEALNAIEKERSKK